MSLPLKYKWLTKEPGPKMLIEALRHYGILEHAGTGSNPNIMAWAKEAGVAGWYTDDDIPWCGLFVAVVTKRCGYPHQTPSNVLGARFWATYGIAVKGVACLWDILVFARPGGHHVGFCVGQNSHAYLVYGGNQSNAVGFAWIAKSRCIAIRRPAYKVGVPTNIRPIYLNETGELSQNEA